MPLILFLECLHYLKSALKEVGYWDTDMITEDIAVSWKLHLADFRINYEPRAMCWMLVPETVGGYGNNVCDGLKVDMKFY